MPARPPAGMFEPTCLSLYLADKYVGTSAYAKASAYIKITADRTVDKSADRQTTDLSTESRKLSEEGRLQKEDGDHRGFNFDMKLEKCFLT